MEKLAKLVGIMTILGLLSSGILNAAEVKVYKFKRDKKLEKLYRKGAKKPSFYFKGKIGKLRAEFLMGGNNLKINLLELRQGKKVRFRFPIQTDEAFKLDSLKVVENGEKYSVSFMQKKKEYTYDITRFVRFVQEHKSLNKYTFDTYAFSSKCHVWSSKKKKYDKKKIQNTFTMLEVFKLFHLKKKIKKMLNVAFDLGPQSVDDFKKFDPKKVTVFKKYDLFPISANDLLDGFEEEHKMYQEIMDALLITKEVGFHFYKENKPEMKQLFSKAETKAYKCKIDTEKMTPYSFHTFAKCMGDELKLRIITDDDYLKNLTEKIDRRFIMRYCDFYNI